MKQSNKDILLYGSFAVLSGIALLGYIYRKEIYDWIKPVVGNLGSRFGNRKHPITGKLQFHNGLDISAPYGTPIKSPLSGEVIKVWTDSMSGNAINIKHKNNLITGYAHLSKFNVKQGDKVKAGDVIGYVGSTGLSTGNHLHLVVKKMDSKGVYQYVDPLIYFPQYNT